MERSREAGGARDRWEVLLGGLAGLGVPMVLWGVGRSRGSRGSPVTVGAAAGLLGALVGGRLARRTQAEPPLPEAEAAPEATPGAAVKEERGEQSPGSGDAPEPRRGPNGRERLWAVGGNGAHPH